LPKITNKLTDCGTCLGGGEIEVCPMCGSNDIENTGPDNCDHDLIEGTYFEVIECPECDGTGDDEEEEE